MDEIVTNVKRVSDLIGEISSAADEQRDGINQVNQAITNLDQMTQQNASLVEESAAAATGLRDQALRLAQVVAVFNVGTGVPVATQIAARTLATPAPAAAPALTAQARPAAPRPAAPPPRLTSTLATAAKPKPAAVSANSKDDDGEWGVF